MFRKISLILLAILIGGCATIQQDQPTEPTQCFEGKFNPHRLVDWKADQPNQNQNFFIFKNPEVGGLPDYVVATVNVAYQMVWRYAYLDGQKVMGYIFVPAKGCYVADPEITPEIEQLLHKTLLKLRNGREA